MFTRPEETYDVAPEAVQRILADETTPLYRVAETVARAASVLDIGAGNGLLGQVLTAAHPAIAVDGLEPSEYAAEIARRYYRRFYVGLVQDHAEALRAENYDFFVLADVIEHLANPLEVMRDLVDAAGEHTRIIISTPNVAFGALRLGHLDGRWDYTDSGLLERTHLRFFTRETLLALWQQAGLHVEREVFHQLGLFNSEIALKRSLRTTVNALALRREDLALTYQFFYVLTTRATADAAPEPERYGHRTTVADVLAWYASPRRLFSPAS